MSAILALGLLGIWTGTPANAQDPTIWRYHEAVPNVTHQWTSAIGDSVYVDSGFGPTTHTQSQRWGTLLSSKYVRGATGAAVFGRDLVEDLELNWTTPTLEAGPGPNGRWQPVESGTFNLSFDPQLTTDNTGPVPNEPWRGSTRLLAMGDEGGLFLNPFDDGIGGYTLSLYNHVNGNFVATTNWTGLSGPAGTLGATSTPITPDLLANHFIGFEQDILAFLNGPSLVEYYGRSNGNYIRSVDYSEATDGPLSQYSLTDIITSNVGGYAFLGMDMGPIIIDTVNIVPEPSSALLSLGALGAITLRRRRNAA